MTVQAVMSPERTQAILTLYLQYLMCGGRFARFFADDVVVSVMWTDLVAKGRDAAEQLTVTMHREAFKATPVIKDLLVGEGKALLEADFVATHVAEFGGKAPTGKEVNVPYCAVYDLKDEKITQLRLYFPMDVLLRQQLIVLQRQVKRPVLTPGDRVRLVLLDRLSRTWQTALLIVQPRPCCVGIARAIGSSGMHAHKRGASDRRSPPRPSP